MLVDRIKHKIEQLEHKVQMMKKRQEQLVHEAYTKRHRERDDEMLRLEVKIEEDEKFIKFLKELVEEWFYGKTTTKINAYERFWSYVH